MVLCLKSEVRGSKHRWLENGKCEIKKGAPRRKRSAENRRNASLISSQSMAADGRGEEFVRLTHTNEYTDSCSAVLLLVLSLSLQLVRICVCIC